MITRNAGESIDDWLKRTRPDWDRLSQAERERAVREAEREHDEWMAPRGAETPEQWLDRTRKGWKDLSGTERRKALREAEVKMDLASQKAELQGKIAEKRETVGVIYEELHKANQAKAAQGRLSPDEQAKLTKRQNELVDEVGLRAGERDALMKELENLDVTPYELARAYSYSDKAALDVTKRATKVDKNLRKVTLVDEYSGKEVVDPSIDHIVPVEEIVKMKGYDRLKPADWKDVLSRTDNLRLMEQARNSSKGARRWEDWPAGRRLYGDEVYEKMVALEREIRAKIEQDILKRAGLAR